MSSDMINLMASAMRTAYKQSLKTKLSHLSPTQRRELRFIEMAKGAAVALRNPTDSMLHAASCEFGPHTARAVWDQIIAELIDAKPPDQRYL